MPLLGWETVSKPCNTCTATLRALQVVAVTPPADDWVQAVMGFGVPEAVARDLANM